MRIFGRTSRSPAWYGPAIDYAGRVLSIGTAFAVLHPRTKKITALGLRLYAYGRTTASFGTAVRNRDQSAVTYGAIKTTIATVAMVGIFFKHPIIRLATIIETLSSDIKGLCTAILTEDPMRLLEAMLRLIKTITKLIIKLYALPELIIAAVILNVLTELARSLNQAQQDRWPEAFAAMAIAGILAQEIRDLLLDRGETMEIAKVRIITE
jgi:hypothetical protein